MKKVLLILLFIIIAAAGGIGTFYFYRENKNQITQNNTLSAQNAQIQAQLNSIGALTTVYEVNTRVYSGNPILETELVPVSVPTSTLSESSIEDINELIGKHYRVDINPGTILSKDMLMDEFDGTKEKYPRELTLTSLPVSTVVGDYIDLRMMLPNGEEYVIFSHKQIKRIYGTTLTFFMSEEENAILNSAIQDLGNYSAYVIIYATKYLEPGNDTDTIAFYPVQHEVENFLRFNPNIDDISRCINEDIRDHIDEVLLVFTDSQNQTVSASFIASLSEQYASQLAAHNTWLNDHTDEEGNFLGDDPLPGGGGGTGVVTSTDSTEGDGTGDVVGDAMDELESDIEDLEAIE